MPSEMANAIGVLEANLAEIDRLVADEKRVVEWRALNKNMPWDRRAEDERGAA